MAGGYANIYDKASEHVVLACLRPQSVTTEKNGEIIDRNEANDLTQHVEFVASIAAATTGGGADCAVVATLTIQHGDQANLSDAEDFKVAAVATLVGVADGNHNIAVAVPVKLLKAGRYIRAQLIVSKTGTGTLSSATAGVVAIKYPMETFPAAAYDKDGYANAQINTAL